MFTRIFDENGLPIWGGHFGWCMFWCMFVLCATETGTGTAETNPWIRLVSPAKLAILLIVQGSDPFQDGNPVVR